MPSMKRKSARRKKRPSTKNKTVEVVGSEKLNMKALELSTSIEDLTSYIDKFDDKAFREEKAKKAARALEKVGGTVTSRFHRELDIAKKYTTPLGMEVSRIKVRFTVALLCN